MSKRVSEIDFANSSQSVPIFTATKSIKIQSSSPVDMRSMPPELKIMILDLLPAKDLLTMALVNKAAREFIHTSPRLMAKFVFVVKNFAEQKSFITEENKKGNSLLFHRVKVMEHISGVRVFKTILGCLKSVIELELHNVTLSSPKRTPYNEIELPNLKILKLMGRSCSWKVTNFLNNAPITSLQMEIFDRNYNGRGYFGDPFNTWLCSRQNLKTLTMTIPAPSFCTLMSPMLLEAQFKLSHLTVKLQDWGLDLISKSIFWDFYAKQSELKTLHVFDYNSSLFEQTEKDFARLNEITIETHYMREYPLHVLLLNKINEVATSLTYKNHAATHYHTMSHRYDSCTVKYVPGNKTAEFVDKKMDTTLLKSIGESWLKANSLKLETMIYGQYKTLSGFKRLRDLSFETCFISTNDWMKIAESLPNLERISINNFVMHDLHVSYIIEKCLKLKRLEFGRGLYPETLLDSFVPTPDRQITFQVTQKMAEQLPMTLLKPPSSCIVEVNDAQFMSHPKVLGRFLQTNKAHLYIFGFINNYQSKTMDRMFNLLVTKQVFDKQRHDMDLELRTIISELK